MGVREAAVLLLGKLEPKDLADRIGIACMRSPRRPPFPTGKLEPKDLADRIGVVVDRIADVEVRAPSPVQTLEPVHASAHHGAHRALSRRSSPCMHALTTAPHSPLRCACAPQP